MFQPNDRIAYDAHFSQFMETISGTENWYPRYKEACKAGNVNMVEFIEAFDEIRSGGWSPVGLNSAVLSKGVSDV